MANLQSQVGLYYAEGVAGDMVNVGGAQNVYTPITKIAETAVTVGQFCFAGTDPYTQVVATKTGATAVMGFVQRVQMYPNYDIRSQGTLTIPAGSNVSVAVAGDFYAKSTTAAAIGNKVAVTPGTGAIVTGATVANTDVDTGWVVAKGGAVGDLIVITKH